MWAISESSTLASWWLYVGWFAWPPTTVYPVSTIPLVAILVVAQYRAKRAGALESYRSPFQLLGWKRLLVSLFWQLDVIGIILIIAVFGLILTPLTLAGGTEDQSRWRDGDILAPLVVGVVCIPAWIIWEIKAPHPMIPFKVSSEIAPSATVFDR
jgi:SIT family siderophore-iron:H+ symporter-like MFS transporter